MLIYPEKNNHGFPANFSLYIVYTNLQKLGDFHLSASDGKQVAVSKDFESITEQQGSGITYMWPFMTSPRADSQLFFS